MQDYTTLNNPKFLFFAELNHPFPDWVAAAPMPKTGDFEKMASTAFADQKRRLLPISSKEAAFHSALDYMARVGDYPEEAGDRIKEACEFYGITDDVAPYAEVFASRMEKEASDESPVVGRYAIDEIINGTHFRMLPLNDAVDVESSAAELAKMASERRIHFLQLLPAARAVVSAAEEYGVSLPVSVLRVGAARMANLEKTAKLIDGRAGFAAPSTDRATLQAAYDEVVKSASEGKIDADECVKQIAALDHAGGVEYNLRKQSHVLLPSEIVFCGPLESELEKLARTHVSVGDVVIPLDEFKKINRTEAEYKLSKSSAESLLKVIDSDNAVDVSMAVMPWSDDDRRTLLRLAAAV
jgi:hypothetical protein